ncbi:single-stranded-DNA-specific exonuclease RecJ [Desulfuromonas sp. CSMB_57]|uniref:single-stranded-DNA-specific exonuclease RecJ n=1 Tax=Desulfuromonas sp. CSMB_57 TaxID=2807629 RepID=UPI001CD77003
MEPGQACRWDKREAVELADDEGLQRSLGISLLTARVLAARGIVNAEQGREFLQARLADLPDPFLLQDMEAAVSRLVQAIRAGERIAVHGDYDVDGVTGTALLVENLRIFGADVVFHVPLRLTEGYGLSVSALEQAAADGVKLVITVDCGISALDAARRAAELGLELIVTDHHQPPDRLPQALAIINPRRTDCAYPCKDLAGVGVAFMLLVALRQRLRNAGIWTAGREPDLRFALDLVALGTIADIVPLRGVNRSLTRIGLTLLEQSRRVGVTALKKVAGVEQVTCGTVGFRLAPRLNAAGRLEDARQGVELLLESSAERAVLVAEQLDAVNRERQAVEQRTLQQALDRLAGWDPRTRNSIVLADADWHPGVIGIVASRLVERFHRPTVLIALDGGSGKGSGRSIRGFHLFRALQSCSGSLQGFGGHEYAAGLSIAAQRVEDFAREFEALARQWLSEDDLQPRQFFDAEVELEELTEATVQELAGLAPFGPGNPQPVVLARQLVLRQVQRVGDNHLRFTACQGGYSLPCIAFGLAERADELHGPMDLLCVPTLNDWRGRTSVQLQVRDFRPAETCSPGRIVEEENLAHSDGTGPDLRR